MDKSPVLRVTDYATMAMKHLAVDHDFDLEVMRSMMWLMEQPAKDIHTLLVLTGKR